MPQSTESTTRPRLLPALAYAALTTAIVSSLGMLLVPTISHDMHVEVSTGQWMLTVNLLVGAVATPIMGRLSDGPHKKRLLLFSLTTILVGSIVAAAAPNFTVFLIGRALQGLTYGIVPVTIALARRYLPENQARLGISSLSVTVTTGLGLGYPLTGILADLLGFRFAFWFAALFLITTILVVWRVVPAGPDEQAPRNTLDVPGALLVGTGLASLLVAVSSVAAPAKNPSVHGEPQPHLEPSLTATRSDASPVPTSSAPGTSRVLRGACSSGPAGTTRQTTRMVVIRNSAANQKAKRNPSRSARMPVRGYPSPRPVVTVTDRLEMPRNLRLLFRPPPSAQESTI